MLDIDQAPSPWDAYITKDCYDLDEACKVLDAFYLDESITIQRWGTEGDYWVREEVDNWFGSSRSYENTTRCLQQKKAK